MPAPYKLIVIESRHQSDEDNGNTEQDVIASVMDLLKVRTKITEVNSKSEFFREINKAVSEHVRYVHISAHGSNEGIDLRNGDFITWKEFDERCWPNLKGVCLSFSSCDVANGVEQLFSYHKTFCSAIVAATRKVYWTESAVAFAAFFLRATRDDTSTEQDVRVMNHICGAGTFKIFRANVVRDTHVLS